jgi:hypothetical protein
MEEERMTGRMTARGRRVQQNTEMKSGALRHLASASNPVFRLLALMLRERGMNVETVKGDDKLSSQPDATPLQSNGIPWHTMPRSSIPPPPQMF